MAYALFGENGITLAPFGGLGWLRDRSAAVKGDIGPGDSAARAGPRHATPGRRQQVRTRGTAMQARVNGRG